MKILNIKYALKNTAKANGAKWDANGKTWYLQNAEDYSEIFEILENSTADVAVIKKQCSAIKRKNNALKKAEEEAKKIPAPKPKSLLKLGDKVRMTDGIAIGTIDKIEKKKAFVNYGTFKTKVNLTELEKI